MGSIVGYTPIAGIIRDKPLEGLKHSAEESIVFAASEREARVAMYADINERKLPSTKWARLIFVWEWPENIASPFCDHCDAYLALCKCVRRAA